MCDSCEHCAPVVTLLKKLEDGSRLIVAAHGNDVFLEVQDGGGLVGMSLRVRIPVELVDEVADAMLDAAATLDPSPGEEAAAEADPDPDPREVN